ncbi:hypothetical protein [Pedobacter antarcticus]|nr:hypothetical protein [Pedobacter antarcticus]
MKKRIKTLRLHMTNLFIRFMRFLFRESAQVNHFDDQKQDDNTVE